MGILYDKFVNLMHFKNEMVHLFFLQKEALISESVNTPSKYCILKKELTLELLAGHSHPPCNFLSCYIILISKMMNSFKLYT